MDNSKINLIIDTIKKKAAEKTNFEADDNFSPFDHSGGNYDDAWKLGTDDGEIYFARFLEQILNSKGE